MNQPKPTVFNYNDYLKLQAENADLKQLLAAKEKSLKGSMSLNGEAIDRIETLTLKLAASQRREQAAVEFIKYLDRNYSSYMTEDERFVEWRDTQEVGKGEAE